MLYSSIYIIPHFYLNVKEKIKKIAVCISTPEGGSFRQHCFIKGGDNMELDNSLNTENNKKLADTLTDEEIEELLEIVNIMKEKTRGDKK